MTTLITRWVWTAITLVLLAGALFLIEFMHTANMVQGAANASRKIAAVTADTSSLQSTVTQSIDATLSTTAGGLTLFNPSSDIHVNNINANQEVQVAVTYHMPVLGPLQKLFGFGPTLAITRAATQSLDYRHNGLNADLKPAPPKKISVSGVTLKASGKNFSLTITGKGFGSAPAGVPGTTLGSFFSLDDVTQGWNAGGLTSGIPVTYGSWNDAEIQLAGIQNYGKGTEVINPGDDMSVTVNSVNGTTTYYFVANTSGTTQYSASLSASTNMTSVGNGVTLTATTSNQGDGTNGLGIYDASTGQYLIWAGRGETVVQVVNSGTATSQDYVAYYGPQGQITSALATSGDVGVTWTQNVSPISAVMMQRSNGGYLIDLFGADFTGATVSGTGLFGPSQISSSELEINAANSGDTSGEVTFSNGQSASFQATPY